MKLPAALMLSALATTTAASPAPLLQSEARHAIQALATSLGGEMKAAMQSGGPQAAISACNEKAMPITDRISKEQGLTISRTALRVRNPANAPDEWERTTLENFIERQQAGEPLKGMMFSEIVEQDGKRYFRMMQAIPTQTQCLGCHGEAIDARLEEKINALYPEDRARGFKAGELRGAFTVRRAM